MLVRGRVLAGVDVVVVIFRSCWPSLPHFSKRGWVELLQPHHSLPPPPLLLAPQTSWGVFFNCLGSLCLFSCADSTLMQTKKVGEHMNTGAGTVTGTRHPIDRDSLVSMGMVTVRGAGRGGADMGGDTGVKILHRQYPLRLPLLPRLPLTPRLPPLPPLPLRPPSHTLPTDMGNAMHTVTGGAGDTK